MAGESRRARLRALLVRAKLKGVDVSAIEPAFVHESAVREGMADHSNERLEFLGDAILGFVVAQWLVSTFPESSEGVLALRKSALVSDAAIVRTARRLGFDALIALSSGLAQLPEARRQSTFGDAFEAFLAALFAAAGFETVRRFVIREHIEPMLEAGLAWSDPKTDLQEWTQRRYRATPLYREHAQGPPHARVFTAHVEIEGEILGAGSGPSKRTAQRLAASEALAALRERFDDVPTDAPALPEVRPLKPRGGSAAAHRAASPTVRTARSAKLTKRTRRGPT